jgi:hypothetical protein
VIPASDEVMLHELNLGLREIQRIANAPGEAIEVTFVNEDESSVVERFMITAPDDFDEFIHSMVEIINSFEDRDAKFGVTFQQYRALDS